MHTFNSHDKEYTELKSAGVSLTLTSNLTRDLKIDPKWRFRILLSGATRILITGCFTYSKMFVTCIETAWITLVHCVIIVDVSVKLDTWTAWQRQMFGWLFLQQNVRAVYFLIIHNYAIPSLVLNASRSVGKSNCNLALLTSNCGFGLCQFDGTAS